MKKLKLRGKEIEKIGFKDNELVSLVINEVQKHFKRSDKSEVLEVLEETLKNPRKYKDDPRLQKIARKLLKPPKTEKMPAPGKSQRFLNEVPKEYVVYGSGQIEPEALEQMETAMRLPVVLKGALMADAHSGYGLPIGGVVAVQNAVIPFGVGMDIGCRMCLSVFALGPEIIKSRKDMIKTILIENTRFGQKDYFKEKKDHKVLDRNEFSDIKFLKGLKDKAYEQLGTSGSGNHFVEFGMLDLPEGNDFNLDGGSYMALLSHSGSRNFGANIAQHYTNIAKTKCNLPKGAINLAWLDTDTEEGIEYWLAMNLAGDYARANHEIIHAKIASALGEKPVFIIQNHHNFAWKEKLSDGREAIVHRKGATPATKGIYGIIPGSMTLPGFIVTGKGNPESLNSASHGAGRKMSRSKAKEQYTQKDLKEALKKAGVELIGGGTDEAPMAYKDIYKVMQYQKELVEIKGTFYPKIVRMSSD
ncbi:MAG: RtcB family protein [Bacteroidales bacterium]|nr:RtcB family protein [Bacteroidales bacterium]